ncbi:hypothetical protein AV650_09195 [Serratia fonticola]|nr:hypothetical protein AV650_09195 [Serratia fonticola]
MSVEIAIGHMTRRKIMIHERFLNFTIFTIMLMAVITRSKTLLRYATFAMMMFIGKNHQRQITQPIKIDIY